MQERLIRIEEKLDLILGSLQSAKLITGDKDLFLEGLGKQTTEDEAEEYEAEELSEDNIEIEVSPRGALVNARLANGLEKTVYFTDLPIDVQRGVSMARTMGQMYQVYVGDDGTFRLATTREVADRMKVE